MPFQCLPSQAGSPMLECTDLGKNYIQRKKSVTLFSKLELQVYPGEICLITGKSGVGKSTLLRLLGGLERPPTAQVTIHRPLWMTMDFV